MLRDEPPAIVILDANSHSRLQQQQSADGHYGKYPTEIIYDSSLAECAIFTHKRRARLGTLCSESITGNLGGSYDTAIDK